ALRTPTIHAEEIKIKYACALEQMTASDETIQVPSVGDRLARRLERRTLAQVVEARYRELFQHVAKQLSQSGFDSMIPAGLVLTGGGSKMEGVAELAEEILHMPVRIGKPTVVTGLSDVVNNQIHATGVGLLIYGSRTEASAPKPSVASVEGLWSRVSHWFKGDF
ncbi:MAG TPA: cell division FtsA domain-containing protein, partial [Wenzhouxiangella sp.]